jgi:putative FmdB family regulatory protein
MPIFEFICAECEQPFEDLVRSAASTDEVICPSCGSSQVKKQISTFASRIAGAGFSSPFSSSSTSSCSTGST